MVPAMNTAAIRSDWVGRVIDGRFTLLQWLGGSEWGGVFLTELQGYGSQKAAIKLIPTDAGDAEAQIAGWAATTTLSHPHLMRLYLEAQEAGIRATGIGCYFDDPVHEVFGISSRDWQSFYHFTVGGPGEDGRLTTLPPYSLGEAG